MRLFLIPINLKETLIAIFNRVVLAIFFYLFVTPLGLLMKLFRKDHLGLRINKQTDSYWRRMKGDKVFSEDYKKQY